MEELKDIFHLKLEVKMVLDMTQYLYLKTKIKHLEGDIPILTAKKVIKQEPKPIQTTPSVPLPPGILEKMEEFKQAQQANITLEINET